MHDACSRASGRIAEQRWLRRRKVWIGRSFAANAANAAASGGGTARRADALCEGGWAGLDVTEKSLINS